MCARVCVCVCMCVCVCLPLYDTLERAKLGRQRVSIEFSLMTVNPVISIYGRVKIIKVKGAYDEDGVSFDFI